MNRLNQLSNDKTTDKQNEDKTNDSASLINTEETFKTNLIENDECLSDINSTIDEARKRHDNSFNKPLKHKENDTIEI